METRKIYFWFGVALILDGLLSHYFGQKCLNSCANNNDFGTLVRFARAGIGGLLVWWNR